jgi:hypothetical protein
MQACHLPTVHTPWLAHTHNNRTRVDAHTRTHPHPHPDAPAHSTPTPHTHMHPSTQAPIHRGGLSSHKAAAGRQGGPQHPLQAAQLSRCQWPSATPSVSCMGRNPDTGMRSRGYMHSGGHMPCLATKRWAHAPCSCVTVIEAAPSRVCLATPGACQWSCSARTHLCMKLHADQPMLCRRWQAVRWHFMFTTPQHSRGRAPALCLG